MNTEVVQELRYSLSLVMYPSHSRWVFILYDRIAMVRAGVEDPKDGGVVVIFIIAVGAPTRKRANDCSKEW